MRGVADKQGMMLLVFNLEDRVQRDHPLRRIKSMADEELKNLSSVFNRMYSHYGVAFYPA